MLTAGAWVPSDTRLTSYACFAILRGTIETTRASAP